MRPWVVTVLFLSMFLLAAQGDGPRIGVVDLNAVFEGFHKKTNLEKQLKQSKTALEEKLKEIDDRATEIRDELTLLEKGTQRYQEFEKKLFNLVQEQKFEKQRSSEEFARTKVRFHEELLAEIRAAIRTYGKENGYTVILQEEFTLSKESLSWHSILYHSDQVDLTTTLLTTLNAGAER